MLPCTRRSETPETTAAVKVPLTPAWDTVPRRATATRPRRREMETLKNAGPSTAKEFKVIGHGSATSVIFGDRALDVRQVAHVIRHSPAYRKGSQKVILYSCNTGRDSNGNAQQLANILGCVVEAPNREIRPLQTGNFLIADKIKRFGRYRLDMGAMIPFKPNI